MSYICGTSASPTLKFTEAALAGRARERRSACPLVATGELLRHQFGHTGANAWYHPSPLVVRDKMASGWYHLYPPENVHKSPPTFTRVPSLSLQEMPRGGCDVSPWHRGGQGSRSSGGPKVNQGFFYPLLKSASGPGAISSSRVVPGAARAAAKVVGVCHRRRSHLPPSSVEHAALPRARDRASPYGPRGTALANV